MNIDQNFVVTMALGIVFGLMGAKVIGWLRAVVSKTRAEKQIDPILVKAKRSYKRKVTAEGAAVKAVKSSKKPNKQRGQLAETKSSARKLSVTAKIVDGTKKRPGRPTNAELAKRKASTAKLIENNSETGNTSTKGFANSDQLLLEKLTNLSPEQLHALANMSISESSIIPSMTSFPS